MLRHYRLRSLDTREDIDLLRELVRCRDSSVATGWTVRGSNPGGGEIFRTRPDRPWDPPSLLYNGYRVFIGGKVAGAWC